MKISVPAEIVHGKLNIGSSYRATLQDGLLVWPDGPVRITVEREQATRSVQANAYYWGVVVKALAAHTGYTPDEMHEVLKVKFIPKDVAFRDANGRVLGLFVIGGSTAKLEGPDFYDYVERIRLWAFEALDVDIPPPDPAWRGRPEDDPDDQQRAGQGVHGRDAALPGVETRGGRKSPRRLGNGSLGASVGGPEDRTGAD